MALPKIFVLVDALNSKQINALRKYLLSRMGEQTDLYATFEAVLDSKSHREIYNNTAAIHTSYLPNSNIRLISNNFSYISIMIEDWIALEQINEESTKDLLLQRWYNKNGLYNLADQTSRKIKKEITTDVSLAIEHSRILNDTLYEQLFSSNPAKYDVKSSDYDDMIDLFFEYTCMQNMMYLIELSNRSEVANLDVKKRKSQLLKALKDKPDTQLLCILQSVYDMMVNDDIDAFHSLRGILQKGLLKEDTKLHFHITAYVVKRSMKFWSKGLLTDAKIIFQLANYGLDHGIYFSDGKVPTARFHNLTGQLCQALSYNDMVKFVRSSINKVQTENQEATTSLCMAQICFYNRRYKDIFKYAYRNDFEDFNQRNLSQSLHLIATFMFRDKEYETYKNTLMLSKYFIKRNQAKISHHLYMSYTNMFTFMKKIDGGKAHEINLDKLSPLLYRSWCEDILKQKK